MFFLKILHSKNNYFLFLAIVSCRRKEETAWSKIVYLINGPVFFPSFYIIKLNAVSR
jgi:hypothetical protein